MTILAIETSSTACSLAILGEEKRITRHKIVPMQQAQLVLPMLDELLSSENIELNHMDAIAFGCGPGSFTGIRIATSVAQGLGFALERPLIPISSLAALAQAAYRALGWKKLLVAIDARINEVYWAIYEVNSAGFVELIGKEKISTPDAIDCPDASEMYGVGSAWEVYREKIRQKPLAMDATLLPTAESVAELASLKFARGDVVKPEDAFPVYLRDEVAVKANKR